MTKYKPALFLDRDGVINKDFGYVYEIERFEFFPEIFEICLLAISSGMPIVIITNQSGIDRGYFSEYEYRDLTQWMISQFESQGIIINDVIHASENPDESQNAILGRRKPSPVMFFEASEKLGLKLKDSIMIGDKESDMISAEKAGIGHRILIGRPEGSTVASDLVENHQACVEIVREIVAGIREGVASDKKH